MRFDITCASQAMRAGFLIPRPPKRGGRDSSSHIMWPGGDWPERVGMICDMNVSSIGLSKSVAFRLSQSVMHRWYDHFDCTPCVRAA